jgi:hypothetical protein
MPSKWSNRFELRPGRWIYVPTTEARTIGVVIKESIADRWNPPSYYYHLQKGGHIAAVRSHLVSNRFLRFDIKDFFGSINRTRCTRCLKAFFPYVEARKWATASTVQDPSITGNKHIPYGFVQSQMLASLCLFGSALGKYLHTIHGKDGVIVSVYVDDVIVSSSCVEQLEWIEARIRESAARSKFALSDSKSSSPGLQISAFNILVSEASMSLEPNRLSEFSAALSAATSGFQRQGILNYVKSVSPSQFETLQGL